MKTQNSFFLNILFFTVTFTACIRIDLDNTCIHGQGQIVERELTLVEFTNLENSSSIQVIISQGPDQRVLAVGHENIIDQLSTTITNNTWNVNLNSGCYSLFDLTLYVTVPEIESIKVKGSGKVTLEDFNQEIAPMIILSGSGDFRMNEFETADKLNVSISGSGCFYAEKGIYCFKTLAVRTSGSGSFNGFNIEADDCTATTSGSGNIQVSVSQNLDATILGSGDIVYIGHPKVVISDNGSGNLKSSN